MSHNLIAVDKGALQMVRNIMHRAGKQEAMDELDKTVVYISEIQIPIPTAISIHQQQFARRMKIKQNIILTTKILECIQTEVMGARNSHFQKTKKR